MAANHDTARSCIDLQKLISAIDAYGHAIALEHVLLTAKQNLQFDFCRCCVRAESGMRDLCRFKNSAIFGLVFGVIIFEMGTCQVSLDGGYLLFARQIPKPAQLHFNRITRR